MKNPNELRKYLFWAGPLFIILIILGVVYTKKLFYENIDSLIKLEPSIKITPGAPVVAYVPIMLSITLVAMILGAVPCKADTLKKVERIVNISVFMAGLIMIGCFFIVTPLQYYAMPKLGYTRCNILEDHPTMYFTDWVRNPDWCVRGKSREWVREQARLAKGQDA